jgi:Family of unknown function (DUF5678)
MDGLQREIVDEKKGQLKSLELTGVGSIGFFGLVVGLTQSWAPEVFVSSDLFPPYPIENLQSSKTSRHPIASSFRSRELDWRRTHREILKSFENEWVVLEGEEIIAHGPNPIEVVAKARAEGIKTPYVFYVESSSEDISKMGL